MIICDDLGHTARGLFESVRVCGGVLMIMQKIQNVSVRGVRAPSISFGDD